MIDCLDYDRDGFGPGETRRVGAGTVAVMHCATDGTTPYPSSSSFLLERAGRQIDCRSASRLGHFDLGVSRGVDLGYRHLCLDAPKANRSVSNNHGP